MLALQVDALKQELLLSHRLGQRFALQKTQVALAGAPRWLYSLRNSDQVLEQSIHGERNSDRLQKTLVRPSVSASVEPYWAEHWHSAYIFDQDFDTLLQDYTLRVYDQHTHGRCKVIELGCGGGVLSLAMACRGIRLLATDYAPEALILTRLNAVANQQRLKTYLLNWNQVRIQDSFELVIGSDIAYERKSFLGLEQALRTLLSRDGVAILAEPYRSMGDEFIDFVLNRGWNVRIEPSRFAGSGQRSAAQEPSAENFHGNPSAGTTRKVRYLILRRPRN